MQGAKDAVWLVRSGRWLSIANPLKGSRYGEIDSPEGKKMSIMNKKHIENGISRWFTRRIMVIIDIACVEYTIDIFYE
jgi:hypothetical protein